MYAVTIHFKVQVYCPFPSSSRWTKLLAPFNLQIYHTHRGFPLVCPLSSIRPLSLDAACLSIEVDVVGVECDDVAVLVGHGGHVDWNVSVSGGLPLDELWDDILASVFLMSSCHDSQGGTYRCALVV